MHIHDITVDDLDEGEVAVVGCEVKSLSLDEGGI